MEPEIQEDGTLIYNGAKGAFIFTADNIANHGHHPEIRTEHGQRMIGLACTDPDCVTQGPRGGRVTYYVVDSARTVNGEEVLTYWKVLTYPTKGRRQGKMRVIASAWRETAASCFVVHELEEIIWTKKDSKIS